MLPQAHRFSRKNFESHRKKMRAFRYESWLFLYQPRRGSPAKFAAVISKKVEKSAVKRNRFRRGVYRYLINQVDVPSFGFHLIALYRGEQIPDNPSDIDQAIKAVVKFLSKR